MADIEIRELELSESVLDSDLYVKDELVESKAISWLTIKTFLKAFFDGFYVGLTGNQTIAGLKTFSTTPIIGTRATTDNSTYGASTAWVRTFVSSLLSSQGGFAQWQMLINGGWIRFNSSGFTIQWGRGVSGENTATFTRPFTYGYVCFANANKSSADNYPTFPASFSLTGLTVQRTGGATNSQWFWTAFGITAE